MQIVCYLTKNSPWQFSSQLRDSQDTHTGFPSSTRPPIRKEIYRPLRRAQLGKNRQRDSNVINRGQGGPHVHPGSTITEAVAPKEEIKYCFLY